MARRLRPMLLLPPSGPTPNHTDPGVRESPVQRDASHAHKRFLLGLPYVGNGPLLRTARELGAAVLLSANSFSRWRHVAGERRWDGFNTSRLWLLDGLAAALDSAGFVAMARYGTYPWTPEAYIDLCAAYPWSFFSAMDYCCEREIASDRATVLDRISMTVRGYFATRRLALQRGIGDRLLPILQGREPADYARCLERMSVAVDEAPVIGIGSVCRRAYGGPNGILAILDRLDDELGTAQTTFHLFGIKGDAAAALRDHPRVASFDSQAYGVHARQRALRDGHSKSNAFLATVMREWYLRQEAIMTAPRRIIDARQTSLAFAVDAVDGDWIDRRVARAREQIRELVEAGEIDDNWLTDERALAWAFDDD
jgi:hypothetical protein